MPLGGETLGCPFDGKCREDCDQCNEDIRADKLAKLIDEAREREKYRHETTEEP